MNITIAELRRLAQAVLDAEIACDRDLTPARVGAGDRFRRVAGTMNPVLLLSLLDHLESADPALREVDVIARRSNHSRPLCKISGI